MTDGYALEVNGQRSGPSEAEHAELAMLRERFRRHHIFCDATGGRGSRIWPARYPVFGHTIIPMTRRTARRAGASRTQAN
jgi:hypothetical protein